MFDCVETEAIILNTLSAEFESAFSAVEASAGSDMESSSEKVFERFRC